MSTEETWRVLAGYVAALQRGYISALRASFAPEATWTIRGRLRIHAHRPSVRQYRFSGFPVRPCGRGLPSACHPRCS